MTFNLQNTPSLRGSRQADAAIHPLLSSFRRRPESIRVERDPDLRRDDGVYYGFLRYARNDKVGECGSVFFYILLAIALFAALSYAVSRDQGGSSNIFTEEQTKIAAQEIIEYGNIVASAVQKLRLRGCTDAQISFENDAVSGYTNGTDTTCQIFHIDGGNINFSSFGTTFFDSSAPSLDQVSYNSDNNVINVGATSADLIFFTSGIKQEVCEEVNNILHSTSSPFTGGDITVGATKFTGSYNGSPTTLCSGTADSKSAGCCYETTGCNGGACYHFYQVLLAR